MLEVLPLFLFSLAAREYRTFHSKFLAESTEHQEKLVKVENILWDSDVRSESAIVEAHRHE